MIGEGGGSKDLDLVLGITLTVFDSSLACLLVELEPHTVGSPKLMETCVELRSDYPEYLELRQYLGNFSTHRQMSQFFWGLFTSVVRAELGRSEELAVLHHLQNLLRRGYRPTSSQASAGR